LKISAFKAPNTYLLIFVIIILTAVLTWIIPPGAYQTHTVDGRELVLPDSYHSVEASPQGPTAVLTVLIRAFTNHSAALIIGFIFIVGGVFSVLRATGAVDAGILSIAKAHERSPAVEKFFIPIFMGLFALGGGTFGMSEEILPFILIFVPLALALGYDSIVGVAIPFVGAGAGFAGAFLNPFTVGIAQQIAEVPLFSGIGYRLIVWLLSVGCAVFFVMLYAARIRRDPSASLSYEADEIRRRDLHIREIEAFSGMTSPQRSVLWIFAAGMALMVYGVLRHHWYIEEISAVFFLTSILCALPTRMRPDDYSKAFIEGARDMVGTVLVVVLARGILIIAEDGQIIGTILYSLSGSIADLHPVLSAQAMFVVQSLINFFVPSGSGQAALTMPILTPLADLLSVSRQSAVLAFQLGDGFTNLIIPTSAVTMGVLTLSGIDWNTWARWIWPLQIIFFLLSLLLLIPPYFLGW